MPNTPSWHSSSLSALFLGVLLVLLSACSSPFGGASLSLVFGAVTGGKASTIAQVDSNLDGLEIAGWTTM